MKRVVVSFMLTLAVVTGASAQSWKDLLGKVAGEVVNEVSSSSETGNKVMNVLGSLLGNSLTLSPEAIEGTWNYEGVACILESENALSEIGGTVVTGQLESKMDEMLSRVGIKSGNCSFVFSKEGSCTILVGGYTIEGTYVLVPEDKVINLSFMYGQLNLKANVAYEIQNLNIVFKADKLLNFIKGITSSLSNNAAGEQLQQLSSISQTAATLGTLLNSYNGMMLGAKMTRDSAGAVEVSSTSTTSAPVENTTNSTANAIATGLGKLFK